MHFPSELNSVTLPHATQNWQFNSHSLTGDIIDVIIFARVSFEEQERLGNGDGLYMQFQMAPTFSKKCVEHEFKCMTTHPTNVFELVLICKIWRFKKAKGGESHRSPRDKTPIYLIFHISSGSARRMRESYI